MKILLPINLDKWQNPISSLLREVAIRIPEHDFYSFSDPQTTEDIEWSESKLWNLPHINKITNHQIFSLEFDIVHHASSTKRNLTAALLAKVRSLWKCQHLFTANVEVSENWKFQNEYRMSTHMADKTISVSRAVSQSVDFFYGVKSACVIPNGADSVFFDPNNISAIPAPDIADTSKPFFIYVATLDVHKRPELFMSIAERLPEANFYMAGRMSLDKDLAEQLSKRIHACSNLHHLGLVDRVSLKALHSKAEALIFPSDIEGLPLSVIEAMMMGVPVLAQNKSSLPELIEHGKTGWLLNDSDIPKWIEIARNLLQESQEVRRHRRKIVRQNALKYDWLQIANAYRTLYNDINH